MDGLFGFIIFAIILAISGIQKWREFREDREFREGSENRPTLDDLPEETRRMLYGSPVVTPAEAEEDEEVEPIPVARPERQRPRPQMQRQATPPPPPPPRPRPAQRQATPPPPPPRQRAQPTRRQPPRTRPLAQPEAALDTEWVDEQIDHQHEHKKRVTRRSYSRLGQEGSVSQMREPSRSASSRRPAKPRPRKKDTSSRGLALRLVNHPTGIRAAIIANEILNKPISMREDSSNGVG